MITRFRQTCSFSYDIAKSFFKLIFGMWKLSNISHPVVTVFGSARLSEPSTYLKQAEEIAKKFIENGYSVLNGGNSGIMEAVSKGATKACSSRKIVTMGISVTQIKDTQPNPYIQPNKYIRKYLIMMPTLFARKILLRHYADAFIVFPGGFGTMDELFEVVELMQTKRAPRKPIVLIGSAYWNPLLEVTQKTLVVNNFIKPEDIQIATVTDDIEEALRIVTRGKK